MIDFYDVTEVTRWKRLSSLFLSTCIVPRKWQNREHSFTNVALVIVLVSISFNYFPAPGFEPRVALMFLRGPTLASFPLFSLL